MSSDDKPYKMQNVEQKVSGTELRFCRERVNFTKRCIERLQIKLCYSYSGF